MTTVQVLEDLPNTVLLDVIQYLSPIDRYRSLHDINHTLDAIIRYGTTHISLSNIESKREFDYHLEHILPDVIASLRSIKISNDFLFDKEQECIDIGGRAIMFGIIKKVQAKINLIAYEKLEELTLDNVNTTQLKLISEKLFDMSQLKRLIISFSGTIADACTSIFNNAVIRSKLKTLKLTLTNANVLFSNSSSTIDPLSNLDYLTVESCIAGNVAVLFTLVQSIKYLNISIWDFPHQSQTYSTGRLTLPNLTCLRLKVDEIRWCFVEHLLKQCGEKLKSFTFIANGYLDFIDPENWKKLITSHLKQLIKFNFHITLWETSISDIHLALFNTDFWHQLNISVACDWMKGSFEDGDIVDVYTVPFCRSSFTTSTSTVHAMSPFINSSYDRIQTLTILLNEKRFRSTNRIYEKVDSIILNSLLRHNSDILLFLNMSIHCNNIHHLGFSSVRGVLTPQIFCQLLQHCPNLYSLRLHSKILDEMTNRLTDEKTCLLLQKMIKQIQFNDELEQEDFDEQGMKRFVQTFTNLQRLYIHMKSSDDISKQLSIMIHDMKELNKIFIKTTKTIPNGFIDQTKQAIVDLNKCYIRKEKSGLFIWR